MSDFGGVIKLQSETLLGELRRQQEARCQELMQAARLEAQELLRQTRRQLHERGRQALAAERKRRAAALQQARNRMRAQESQRVQSLYAELLRQAWPQLIEQLRYRWSNAASRRAWCENLLHEASSTLQSTAWLIEHPEDWSDKDTRWLASAIKDSGLPEATLRCDLQASAGLKICSGSACVDGTINGLLVRGSYVEARLLAAWELEPQQKSGDRDD